MSARSVYDAQLEEREYHNARSSIHHFNTLYSKGYLPDMRLKEVGLYDKATASYRNPSDPECEKRIREYDGPQPPPPNVITGRDPGDEQQDKTKTQTQPDGN